MMLNSNLKIDNSPYSSCGKHVYACVFNYLFKLRDIIYKSYPDATLTSGVSHLNVIYDN